MSSTMYQAGDVVRIREDLSMHVDYPMLSGPYQGTAFYCVVPEMKEMVGKSYTIRKVEENRAGYRLKECDYIWTDTMFEPMDDECYCTSLL